MHRITEISGVPLPAAAMMGSVVGHWIPDELPNCEKHSLANNTGSSKDLSEVTFYSRLQWWASHKQQSAYGLDFHTFYALVPKSPGYLLAKYYRYTTYPTLVTSVIQTLSTFNSSLCFPYLLQPPYCFQQLFSLLVTYTQPVLFH